MGSSREYITSALLFVAATVLSSRAEGQLTYWIDEVADYGNGCAADDLNTVTASLRSTLDAHDYTGVRFKDALAWPQDFMESCSTASFGSGLDSADTKLLTVFAGHGNTGLVAWGTQRGGVCGVRLGTSNNPAVEGVARLGQMNNALAGYSVWITSCTLKKSSLAAAANFQWLNQQFGFHNSPAIEAHQPKDWFNSVVGGRSNKTAWLDELEDKQGLFTGDNSPIVVSYGSTSSGCTQIHNDKRLVAQILLPRGGGPSCGGGPPAFFYCATLRDNGGSGVCN